MPPLPGDELPVGGLAPEAIDVEDVLADAGDGYLQEAISLGRFEEDPFLLRQAMSDPAIADLPAGRLPATESLDVILIRLRHTEQAKGEGWKRKWAGQKRVPDRIALVRVWQHLQALGRIWHVNDERRVFRYLDYEAVT